MILSEGKNRFENNTFSFWEWSAPVLQTPEEVIRKVHELRLVGRTVKDIAAVGMGYNWEYFEGNMPEDRAPDDKLRCFAELSDPLLIAFEDGDILAIDYVDGSSIRMGLNDIPFDILPDVNSKNFHANRLFKDVIGKKLYSLEVVITTQAPDFTEAFGMQLDEQISYIGQVDFLYGPVNRYWPQHRLSLTNGFGFAWVKLKDFEGNMLTWSADEELWIVEGYYMPKETGGVSDERL